MSQAREVRSLRSSRSRRPAARRRDVTRNQRAARRASRELHDRRPASARSRPPFTELGRIRLVDLPVEEIVVAGPRVNQAAADFASEAAGTLGRLLFLGHAVGQRATGTAEIFDDEKTACHPAMMLSTAGLSSPTGCKSQRPATRTVGAGGVRDSAFLTRR